MFFPLASTFFFSTTPVCVLLILLVLAIFLFPSLVFALNFHQEMLQSIIPVMISHSLVFLSKYSHNFSLEDFLKCILPKSLFYIIFLNGPGYA